ncbi:wd repeat-containing protein [Anaeramoeba ignava]|uniref:Wd repeat-containing protein n=1 Tax=Anaeramoeba ignava TaxID=1746090 RepID=A0A9Q0LSH9_ANAIG|nr:wd repeat-containing protein [Anaeramoeba ignava]
MLKYITGGNINSNLIFSQNSKLIFVSINNQISIINTNTGETVSQLKGHTGFITDIKLNPSNSNEIFSSSIDGTIRRWNINEASLINTYYLNKPIISFTLNKAFPDDLFLILYSIQNQKENKPKIPQNSIPEKLTQFGNNLIEEIQNSMDLKNEKEINQSNSIVNINVVLFNTENFKITKSLQRKKINFPKFQESFRKIKLEIDKQGKILAFSFLFQVELIDLETNSRAILKHRTQILSINFHPFIVGKIATGSKNGHIRIWENPFQIQQSKNPTENPKKYKNELEEKNKYQKLHWHAHDVSSLMFTEDGKYLLSGGEESVLVIWQLETGKKNFIPRIGTSGIKYLNISPNSTFYSVVNNDNTIWLIKARESSLHLSISKFKAPSRLLNHQKYKLAIEPRNYNLVSNFSQNTLHFYDIFSQKQSMDLRVSFRNIISRGTTEINPNFVEFFSFSFDGNHLATIDFQHKKSESKNQHQEVYLKFWEFQNHKYVLNTQFDSPHSGAITSILFHPEMYICVTTSDDSTFKIWKIKDEKDQTKTNVLNYSWVCRSTGYYNNKTPIIGSSFSGDGSVLGLLHHRLISLWNPFSNSLLSSIAIPHPDETFIEFNFVMKINPNHLIASTRNHVYVFDLLSTSLLWSISLDVEKIFFDNFSNKFIIVTKNRFENEFENEKQNQNQNQNQNPILNQNQIQYLVLFKSRNQKPHKFLKLENIVVEKIIFFPSNPNSNSNSNPNSNSNSNLNPNYKKESSRILIYDSQNRIHEFGQRLSQEISKEEFKKNQKKKQLNRYKKTFLKKQKNDQENFEEEKKPSLLNFNQQEFKFDLEQETIPPISQWSDVFINDLLKPKSKKEFKSKIKKKSKK